ncbi:MAG TPA: multiheme c-type cytochrome, partial [Burkholderiaceae bacterium]|nr:multiheme c-type cytochrome [Burkholderiaceae bacterium]
MSKKRKPDRPTTASLPAPPAAGQRSGPRTSPRWAWVLTALTAVLLLAAVAWQLARAPTRPATNPPIATPVVASFAGSLACKSCHEQQYSAWTSSQHARAMQHATAETVRGDFNDAKLTYQGVTSIFFKRDGRFFVRTDGPDGKLDDFEVKYTFGVEPLQQYLVELPGGRLQALAVSWDTRPKEAGGQRWFRQYPDEKIDFRDELHWTRRAQNWNFMCADCHSSQITKGYDATKDAFATHWNEISVGCESCHGPGSAHVAWAASKSADPGKGLTVQLDERRGVSWSIDPATGNATRSRQRTSEREIEVCAQCHARRAQIAEGYRAGQRFMDHYLPALLTPGLYHVDGQQRDEVFIWGSWLQSRMQKMGVTCSDCHEPHSQRLQVEGNAVCGQCHAAGKFDTPAHHHHPAGSAGAQCVGCHMPQTNYMVVDARRDHSMRVPRPDLSATLGVPNACNGCHRDHPAEWAAAAVRSWLGRDAQGFQRFATAFHAAEAGQAGASASLAALADDVGQPPIVRASALERLATAGTSDAGIAQRAARDAQPLLRLAAVRLAESLPPPEQVRVLSPLLSDSLLAVRIEAARALAGSEDSFTAERRAAWQRAADQYLATLAYTADRPEARVALGSFQSRLRQHDAAQAAFAQAIALDPAFVPAYLNAADDLRAQKRDAEARQLLQQGLARAPKDAALHYALGLTLVRLGERPAAVSALERAVQLAPDEPRYTYVYAVARNSTGRAREAIAVLERAAQRWPA